jgi:hypothetical protein
MFLHSARPLVLFYNEVSGCVNRLFPEKLVILPRDRFAGLDISSVRLAMGLDGRGSCLNAGFPINIFWLRKENDKASHFQYHVSGTLRVRMDDGTEKDFMPGDVSYLKAGP